MDLSKSSSNSFKLYLITIVGVLRFISTILSGAFYFLCFTLIVRCICYPFGLLSLICLLRLKLYLKKRKKTVYNSQQNWEKVQGAYIAPVLTCLASRCQCSSPEPVQLLQLMNLHRHSIITQKFIIHTKFPPWYCMFYGFGQRCTSIIRLKYF